MDSLAPKASYTRHEAFADEADDYLDKHNIYQLFSQLYQQLVIQRPADPISYLISQLEEAPAQDLRVIIAGPRGSDKDEYVNRLASDLNLTILNTAELIKRELTTDSSLSKQLKPLNDTKQTIPDEMLISLIAQAVNDPRVRKYGWILTDYPRTRHQAQLLQSSGILCNHFFLLQKPGSGSQDETKLKKNNVDERPEYRQIATFLDLYTDVLHYIDDTRQNQQTYGEIKTIVTKTPTNNAPKRPMRILLLGKKGAGKATQATLLARRFGIIPISVGTLLRIECERSQEIRNQVEPFLKEGWLVPDKIVIPLVSARLLSSDARTRGWVLDGYPRTLAQAQALTKIHIVPNRCIILDVKVDIANERVIHRRHDPLTGDIYHLKRSSPALSIASRLIHKVEDTAPILQAINASYQGSEEAIRAHYGDIVRVFDANSSHQQTTAEAIQEFLLAPLTSKPKV